MLGTVDLEGKPRIEGEAVDMGAYEHRPFACGFVADRTVGGYPQACDFEFTSYVVGTNTSGLYYWWDFENDGVVDAEGLDMQIVRHTYPGVGLYSVSLTVSNTVGETASSLRSGYIEVLTTRHVSLTGSGTPPYESWSAAALNIQDAVDYASQHGGLVFVTNGTYWTSNAVSVSAGITVQSVNGPGVTIVRRDGSTGHRIFYVNHEDAVVDGFTMRDGNPYSSQGGAVEIYLGGTVRNCIMEDNDGGNGAGAVRCTSPKGLIDRCIIRDNDAGGAGGGVYLTYGTIRNSLIVGNRANDSSGMGGGIYAANGALVENCTVVDNETLHYSGTQEGGGIYCNGATVRNTIIYGNRADEGVNWTNSVSGATFEHVCTTPLPPGAGNSTGDPQFVSAGLDDYRLILNSPCIDAGTNQQWMLGTVDLESVPRVLDGNANGAIVVDMGAHEFASDAVDQDGDGLSDAEEVYTHGTHPLDPDFDDDHMPDGWEVDHSLNPLSADANDDPDTDGLTNIDEYLNDADPQDSDTDDDGLSDGTEVHTHGTEPDNRDTDADTMPDGWEVGFLLNPLVDDSSSDPDHDTMLNGEEYFADTIPTNADSLLSVIGMVPTNGGFALIWKGGEWATQHVESCSNLLASPPVWSTIWTNLPKTLITNTIPIPSGPGGPMYYRLKAGRN